MLNSTKAENFGLNWSKIKAFMHVNINVIKESKFILGRVENMVRKGKIAGYQHFLLFLQCFQKACVLMLLKGVCDK